MGAPDPNLFDHLVGGFGAKSQRPGHMAHLVLGLLVDHRPFVHAEAAMLGRAFAGCAEKACYEFQGGSALRYEVEADAIAACPWSVSTPSRDLVIGEGVQGSWVIAPQLARPVRVVRPEEGLYRVGDPLLVCGRSQDRIDALRMDASPPRRLVRIDNGHDSHPTCAKR